MDVHVRTSKFCTTELYAGGFIPVKMVNILWKPLRVQLSTTCLKISIFAPNSIFYGVLVDFCISLFQSTSCILNKLKLNHF